MRYELARCLAHTYAYLAAARELLWISTFVWPASRRFDLYIYTHTYPSRVARSPQQRATRINVCTPSLFVCISPRMKETERDVIPADRSNEFVLGQSRKFKSTSLSPLPRAMPGFFFSSSQSGCIYTVVPTHRMPRAASRRNCAPFAH